MMGLRQVFDSVCGEYLGAEQASQRVLEIMKEENVTFEQVIIAYFSSLNDRTLYWLEGLSGSLYHLMVLECVRDWVLSYRWENLILYHPFNNRGWPHFKFYDIMQHQMHLLVDEARIVSNVSAKNTHRKPTR